MIWILLILLTNFYATPVFAWGWSQDIRKANKLLKSGDVDRSIEYYQKSLEEKKYTDLVNYNLGTALYKKGDYARAVDYLQKAVAANIKSLKTSPEYNLGNAYFKLGLSKENNDIDGAVSDTERALNLFKHVLEIDKKDKDAKFNLDIVTKKLKELKEKQKQQKKKSKQGKSDKDNQNNQDKQQANNQSKSNQDKDQQKDESPPESSKDKDKDKNKKQDADANDSNAKKDKAQEAAQDKAADDKLEKKEAQAILEEYQRNEEPQGLLNFIPKDKDERPVEKDW